MHNFGFILYKPNTLKDIIGIDYLDERVGEDICKKLHLNVIFLQRGAALTSSNHFKHTIGIFGNHAHFQPVYFTVGPSQKCPVEIIPTKEIITNVGFILPTATLDPVYWQENVLLRLDNGNRHLNIKKKKRTSKKAIKKRTSKKAVNNHI
jgi:hypothetical protein